MRTSVKTRVAAAAATTVAALALTTPAQAYELTGFGVKLIDPGTLAHPTPTKPQLQAGAHPDVTFELKYPMQTGQNAWKPAESVRSTVTNLPPGMIMNPTVVPKCTNRQLSVDYFARCPAASQIGTAVVAQTTLPVFNMVPPPGVPAQFGFNYSKTTVKLNGGIRTGGDYGMFATVDGISQALPLADTVVTLWGVPADPLHDAERMVLSDDGTTAIIGGAAGIPPRPLTSNPGQCTGNPLTFTASAASWDNPFDAVLKSTTTQLGTDEPLAITGCESLPFEPSVRVRPTTSAPDSPTGLDVTVSIPQSTSPQAASSAHLKDLTMLLPEGMNVNPSAADGQAACGPAQIGIDNDKAPTCPDASTLGTVTIDTPLLDKPMQGKAFLAAQNDNPFNTTLAMYITAERDGALVKLAGRIDADPTTGRLRVTFADNPQLPFNSMRVQLDGGPRAPLTTPDTCGPKTVEATATPWSGTAPVALTDSFSVDCTPGLGGFTPGFQVATGSPTAGLFSPLGLSFTRPDGQAQLKNVTVQLPGGLLAKVAGVPLCADAQASAGGCGAESRVGTASVTAGTGSRPFPLRGDVFLTGPYKGAPYGLSTRVRVVAGPLDLGTVVVRQALHIDPDDAHVTAVSDPLPTILSGIPVRLRTLDFVLDREGFTVNPTNCAPKTVSGTLGAVNGATASVSSRFQVGGCQALPLSPKLSMKLVGKGKTLRKLGHPGIQASMSMPPSQSGLKQVNVTLPLSLSLDPKNAKALCETDAGAAKDPQCPAGSIIGTATVKSPILPEPLTGPVYFVKGMRTTKTGTRVATLPTLVLPLRGNGLQINVRATTTVEKKKLVTRFVGLPDAPVSRFDLKLNGGKHGVLTVGRPACSTNRRVSLRFAGQNGRERTGSTQLGMSCGQKKQ